MHRVKSTKKQDPGAFCAPGSVMEQATGIEPAYQAWEACALPLSYACMKTAGRMPLLSGVP